MVSHCNGCSIRVRYFSTSWTSPRVFPYSGAFFSRLSTWYTLLSQKYSFWSAPMWLKFWKLLWEAKIKMCKSFQIRVKMLWNDERIPNMVSEFKSGNIWTHFLTKKQSKWQKSYILPIFSPKGGQMLSDLNYEIRFGILPSFHNFLTHICKDLHILIFLACHSNFQNINHIRADEK